MLNFFFITHCVISMAYKITISTGARWLLQITPDSQRKKLQIPCLINFDNPNPVFIDDFVRLDLRKPKICYLIIIVLFLLSCTCRGPHTHTGTSRLSVMLFHIHIQWSNFWYSSQFLNNNIAPVTCGASLNCQSNEPTQVPRRGCLRYHWFKQGDKNPHNLYSISCYNSMNKEQKYDW